MKKTIKINEHIFSIITSDKSFHRYFFYDIEFWSDSEMIFYLKYWWKQIDRKAQFNKTLQKKLSFFSKFENDIFDNHLRSHAIIKNIKKSYKSSIYLYLYIYNIIQQVSIICYIHILNCKIHNFLFQIQNHNLLLPHHLLDNSCSAFVVWI